MVAAVRQDIQASREDEGGDQPGRAGMHGSRQGRQRWKLPRHRAGEEPGDQAGGAGEASEIEIDA